MTGKGVLDTTLGFHIARASVVAYDAFEQHIGTPHGLRKVDFSLLMLVAEHSHLAPKVLAKMLSLTAPKLSMVLDRMQARGLIDRTPDPLDRRSVQVTLTAEGVRLARALEPVARRMEQGLKKRLSAADHARLIQLLSKLASPPG
ncbi:MAG: MarR family transcriptional regulator [Burkholderiales bacterium]|jgi:DNA-binding MarR family transcriptional regulator|nr:MarR family transcriptional regulator [Burkholderiales bacterium]NBW47125.1 MarR family transcriptional regulator [Betaproteobacteria bacterium]